MDILILIIVAFITGTFIEKRHFRRIKKEEMNFLTLPTVSFQKNALENRPVKEAFLVTGQISLGGDYFKYFIAMIQNFIGGRLTTYEPLLDRARRSAILRMQKKAKGADIIINTKIDTSSLDDFVSRRNFSSKISVLAYGTAIVYEK